MEARSGIGDARRQDTRGDLDSALRVGDLRLRVIDFAGRPIAQGVAHARSQSYDHCHNYFQDNRGHLARDMEKSCAVLGFYLASWGMYRGSSYLFNHTNSAQFRELIQYIDSDASGLTQIDLDAYGTANIDRILSAYKHIGDLVLEDRASARVTLVTKIMIAVFGCVPAFDTYFMRGMSTIQKGLARRDRASFYQLDARRLSRLSDFYQANRAEIDALHSESRTVNFADGAVTDHKLTRAKIVDMYAFNLGADPDA